MSRREEFYRRRDHRSVEYGIADEVFTRPVAVVVGRRAAASPRGQIATLALVNMLSRIHRSLRLEIPSAPLHHLPLVKATHLDDAAAAMARAIDPFIELDGGRQPFVLGIGDAPAGLSSYVGFGNQVATLQPDPAAVDEQSGASLGACLAGCIGAATALWGTLGRQVPAVCVSAWNLQTNDSAQPGPAQLPRLDVGRVLQVGAGGVGSCLAYWLSLFGIAGEWHVADRDLAELHNTNRCLGLLARDAGWETENPRNKAEAAAALMAGVPHPEWYHEMDAEGPPFDLVLPLANEHQVRHDVAHRGEPLILHATTSSNWEAQLHRHLPSRDDCIICRMAAGTAAPQFGCSQGELPVSVPSKSVPTSLDAALPFLSAAAGLMLLGNLYRLQHGVLAEGKFNHWRLAFRDAQLFASCSVCKCSQQCGLSQFMPQLIRQKIHAGRRWSHLDR